ncbi:hypothetical protein AB6A40_009411 [Gnathostoma spinigerum]|uniref:Uncharacterized protein n=1 Tax=Gnathostoma spinigerum TaxID=75299 RepID=A0ABD6F0S2_9BILA
MELKKKSSRIESKNKTQTRTTNDHKSGIITAFQSNSQAREGTTWIDSVHDEQRDLYVKHQQLIAFYRILLSKQTLDKLKLHKNYNHHFEVASVKG